MKNFIFVAGSAHLDVISEVTDFPEVVDKKGKIRYEFGGTAYNYATNIKQLGENVTFMGALNNSPISQMILGEMLANGVRTHVYTDENLSESGFCAQVFDGDLLSAVSSTPVEDIIFSKDFIMNGMSNSKAVMLDCNLSVRTLDKILEIANELKIPSFVAGVSEAKCRKVLELKNSVDYILLNKAEMIIIENLTKNKDWGKISKAFNSSFIITQGSEEVIICFRDGKIKSVKVSKQAVKGNTLGAGDLFGSSFICDILKGYNIEDSVSKAVNETTKILANKHANLGRKKALEENIQLITIKAENDKLTGVLNRHGIEKFISANNIEETNAYIAICDIDFFKKFNDTYGHEIGDVVLQQVATVIKKCVRKEDAVGRWGGEEFICLIKTDDKEEALSIAERIRQEVQKINIENVKQKITISIGLAKSSPNSLAIDDVKIADKFLYKAKEGGRNRVCY